jgi:hypothetical protein
MTNQTVSIKAIKVNLSPEAFHRYAEHYYKCKQDFKPPHKFSPVPYFLLCRAIELALKSKHLKSKRQREVKGEYGHDLMLAYEALPKADKTLSDQELEVLQAANAIYKSKGFEYFKPVDALRGYSTFPELEKLDAIANTLLRSLKPV